jgi:hypothetical protein
MKKYEFNPFTGTFDLIDEAGSVYNNLDGGCSNTVYTSVQFIDGGNS